MNRFETTWLGQIQSRGDGLEGSRILVACSGGGDSTALLVFLWSVRKSLGLDLVVAHADHGLRPEASEDAAFVQTLCRNLDLDLAEARLDVTAHAKDSGIGLETAARNLRGAWLRAECASCGAVAVATGHTLDDHTETVLMRLARGGGIGSLTPLPARQELRWSPLIQARRGDLRTYLRQRHLPWREDASNFEDFTARNRWRKLLESIRQEAPALDDHLWETHAQVEELKVLRDRLVQSWKGTRWDADPQPSGILLTGAWTEPELRWTLDAAFREQDWPREAHSLRDLAHWALPILGRRSKKLQSWGGWQLSHRAAGWSLRPIREGASVQSG